MNSLTAQFKLSHSSSSEVVNSIKKKKMSSTRAAEEDDSSTLLTYSSCSSLKSIDSGTRAKISSCSLLNSTDSSTLVEISLCSSIKPTDSSTLVEISSCSSLEPDDNYTYLKMLENSMDNITLEYISVVNVEIKYRENKRKIAELAEYNKTSNKSRQEKIKPLQENGLMYKEFSESKKIGKESRKAIQLIIRKLSDSLLRSFELNVSIKLLNDEVERNPSDHNYVVIIDGILDKITHARKCANWFLYKACNLDILCDDIQYIWIYNYLKLTSYANLMDKLLGFNNGADKEYMYDVYINHKKGDFEKLYLRKLHQGEIDLEKSDRKYKLLEARKSRFERSRLCKSEHSAPFCELCGWPSTWLKTFKKRGIYIKEAPHWTAEHIWYNEINDELDE